MNFVTTVETLKTYDAVQKLKYNFSEHKVLVETVGYQDAMAQHMKTISDIRIE